MILLCEARHHLVHEGGWTFTLRDAHITLTSPDGRTTLTASPRTAGTSRSISGQQTGDPLDLGYATHTIAHNITLARRDAAPDDAAAEAHPADGSPTVRA